MDKSHKIKHTREQESYVSELGHGGQSDYQRGRNANKSLPSERNRSISSTRRQQLFDDLKKYTKETKERRCQNWKNDSMLKSYSEDKSSNAGSVINRARHRRCSSVDTTRTSMSVSSTETRKRKYNRSFTVAEITTKTDECATTEANSTTRNKTEEGYVRTCTASIRFDSMKRHRSLDNVLSRVGKLSDINRTPSKKSSDVGMIPIIEMK